MTIEIRAEAKAKALEICKAGFKLSSGHNIPAIGFGTWALTPGTDTVEAVKCALQSGYRLIDGAAFYGNENQCRSGFSSIRSSKRRALYYF